MTSTMLFVLMIVFISLKLGGAITWSWGITLIPFWLLLLWIIFTEWVIEPLAEIGQRQWQKEFAERNVSAIEEFKKNSKAPGAINRFDSESLLDKIKRNK